MAKNKTPEEIAAAEAAALENNALAKSEAELALEKQAEEIAALKAELAASKEKEVGADKRIKGEYKASNGLKYRFKDGQRNVRMKKGGLIVDSAALIAEANKKDGALEAKDTMEHLVELGYSGIEEIN